MAIILKANTVNLFISSFLFVSWYHSLTVLDTPRTSTVSGLISNLLTNQFNQYSDTNEMNFLIILLRTKGLYMFRALLAHPQEALRNGTWYIACVLCQLAAGILRACYVSWLLVYCVRVMSVGCSISSVEPSVRDIL
jgi:hypothetical protein